MKKLFTLFFLATLVGCGLLPDIRLKRTIAPSEVIGIWTLTERSLQDIKTDSDAVSIVGSRDNYRIEIRQDGALRYRSLLQMPTRHVDSPGTWKLGPLSDEKPGNQLHVDLDLDGHSYSFSLYFTEDKGKLHLWTFFGDPDNWRLEMYEKEPPSRNVTGSTVQPIKL